MLLEPSQVALDLRSVGLAQLLAPATDVTAQRCDRAAGLGMCDVLRGHVPIHECRERIGGTVGQLGHPALAFGQRVLQRRNDQLLARVEVLVEATVGHPRLAHDLCDAGSLGSAPTYLRGRHLDDPLSALCLVRL